MKKLLSIEYTKLRKLGSFKAIFLIYIFLAPLAVYSLYHFFNMIMGQIVPGEWNPLKFPDIWRFSTYASSYFNVLMGVIIVLVIANEYNYKTLRQNVIDGLSVKQVIISKFLVVFIISTLVSLYTMIMALVFGVLYSESTADIFNGIEYLGIYYLQTLCYFSFAFFLTVLIRKTALSIIFFVVAFILETIIGVLFGLAGFQKAYAFFPLNSFSKLTPLPILEELVKSSREKSGDIPFLLDMSTNILVSLLYMILFFLIAYMVMRKRDL
ncbi:MAG: ABC transporter permease [Brumimicrobium sp.]|nr:ABC transporter permease [Brumimicrobium sp.]